MLKLNPIKSDKIWGYELWIASTHQNGCQSDFKNSVGGEYPLLVKIIQADDALSVQVHPDDYFAEKFEGKGNCGKTECWLALDAKPGAKLVRGVKKGYSNEILAKAIKENALEQYLEFAEVQKGDFIFIPAGTVHAVGAGLRLLEVQQSCDLTYRLYDWGRGREVHLEKGIAVIKNDDEIPVKPFKNHFECEYFSLEQADVNGGWSMICPKIEKPQGVRLLYVLEAQNAAIKTSNEKIGSPIQNEEIYAVFPGEKITIEGRAKIMKIIAK